jgi:selenocysteine lyase/cysteine desulfurase
LTLNLNHIAAEFPGAQDKAFLDAACVSLAPRSACSAVNHFLQIALTCPAESSTQHHINMDAMRRQAVQEAAALLNTGRDQIALVESTTHGLNTVAAGLPLPPGSEVLVSEMEFLQVALPWVMQEPRGVRVIPVPHQTGRVLPEDFAAHLSRNTRMIILSSTQWNNGFRADLSAFASLCRRHDLWFVVDAIQQLGAMVTHPEADAVDILMAGGHKWLNAPFGCGILYASPKVLEHMRPPTWGYLNLEDPDGGWGTYFSTPSIQAVRSPGAYPFVASARKLETGGTSNYPGAIGLAASLHLFNELGATTVQEHVLGLTDYLMERLPAVGARLVTPPERQHRSGIVTFRFYQSLEAERALVHQLTQQRVFVSIRFTAGVGGVRVSCHLFNTPDHIDALLDGLRYAARHHGPDFQDNELPGVV